MKKIKKYVAILTLFNILFLSILIIPQQKAHAALPVIAGQVIKETAERAMLKVVRKAGYKALNSPSARKEVLSIYSRLSPAGKEAFDTAVATAVKANNLPGWAKFILPATLIGEIGLIASGLTSDSANGIPIEYNEEIPTKEAIVLTFPMAEQVVREGLNTRQIGSFSLNNNGVNTRIFESISNQYKAVGSPAWIDKTFMHKFTVTHYQEGQHMIKIWYTSTYGAGQASVVASTAVIAQILEGLTDKMIVQHVEQIPDLQAEAGAVTGSENAYEMEVVAPITEEEPMTFADYWGQTLDNPDYSPENVEFDEPVTEPETKPVESEWWKWLTSPLEKILELLKSLVEWLKSTFGQIPEWFSSILSKLADLLGAWGEWFGKLFAELGSLFQPLYDWWAKLFTDLGAWFNSLWDWLGDILAGILALPETVWTWFWDNLVGNPQDVNMDKLKNTGTFFTTKFPFSLPWDIQRSLEAVFAGVGSELPTWQYPLMGQTFEIKVPALFESWGVYIRGFMLIMFDIALVYSVRKLLGGAS